MKTRKRFSSKKLGLPPGSLVHIGEQTADPVTMNLMVYTTDAISETTIQEPRDATESAGSGHVIWLNVNGLHQVSIIAEIGEMFGLHPLVLEDIVHTGQRPKLEDYGDFLFIVVKMLTPGKEGGVRSEQISFILGEHLLISFQERIGDVFDPVRERLRGAKGRIRNAGPDYLLYALVDIIVDNYFIILEQISERLEILEDRLVTSADQHLLHELHRQKRELAGLRHAVWPIRDLLSGLERLSPKLIAEDTRFFFRDVYDHIMREIETLETYRDIVTSMVDTYLSSISNKMNEVMKVLTIIATLFIPLTFIAGVYGMNFKYMPELGWRWGYPAVWGLMVAVGAVMFMYFKRKNWL
ncbi:magnesium/cobalt transporter CorA [bacterium]|nr:magnesium/cobalt transporter CorA [candidate division CSSED10-310 bacterium]